MINADRCVFNFSEHVCEALTTKHCEGCKFRKTVAEFTAGQVYADDILTAKGLERYQIRVGKNLIVTTRKRGETI